MAELQPQSQMIYRTCRRNEASYQNISHDNQKHHFKGGKKPTQLYITLSTEIPL